jgi:hypothetical protein
VYVITHSKYFSLKLYIDKEDFSIIRIEFIETKPHTQINNIDKRRNLTSRYMGSQKVIDFKKVEGKMYLNYITSVSKVNWYDLTTNELKFETELQQQLLINEVTPNTRERIKENQRMRNYGLQYQDQPYNKAFWQQYNMIKESPLDKKIIEDLEMVAPLDKQFEGKY